MDTPISIQLQKQKLSSLKDGMVAGIWAEQDRKKKLAKLSLLLQNAIFLQKDPERKSRWIRILDSFDDAFLEKLTQAIIEENMCYKKGERDIVIELNKKITQNFSHP